MAGLIVYTVGFALAMVSMPVAVYYFVRALPGLIQRGPTTWLLAPFVIFLVSEYRPEYQRQARHLRAWLFASLIGCASLWIAD